MPGSFGSSEAEEMIREDSAAEWVVPNSSEPPRLTFYTQRTIDEIRELDLLDKEDRFAIEVVSRVLPFRVNEYVIRHLINWTDVPNDPIYRLTFPQREMLSPDHFAQMARMVRRGADKTETAKLARRLREQLNPHPAGQVEMNRPKGADGETINGLQHKYGQTVLFFPREGQTCHSYCTFCFRWAQFVGETEFKIRADDREVLHHYLATHPEVSDLLVTGGDPMVMKTQKLRNYLLPLLAPGYEHIQNIRIGTKALTFWPYRFVTDSDADELLRLIERLAEAGKHVALMAHFNHWRELETPIARLAVRRLRDAGAEIRSQGPILHHINDDPDVWARLWKNQVRLGIIPYYMFVERDTGARNYFELPLLRAWEIYREAIQRVSGLARTVRGPSMSTGPGKIEIQGVAEVRGEKVFALRFLQGRNPEWAHRPFFAKFREDAMWLDHLEPAFGEKEFFFEAEYRAMCANAEPFLSGKKLT